MLSSTDVEFVHRVIVNHFWYCIKWFAKLSQDIFVVLCHNFQMHEGVVISEKRKKKITFKQTLVQGVHVYSTYIVITNHKTFKFCEAIFSYQYKFNYVWVMKDKACRMTNLIRKMFT